MTSSQLSTFLLVCEYLNFTEASTRLYITPSAVSRQMSHLEEELDAKLFIRNNNSVSLTAAGRELYTGLQQLFPMMHELFTRVSNISRGIEGNLRIGLLLDQSIDETVKTALRYLKDKNPHVTISVKHYDFRALQEHLLNGSLDLIITLAQTSAALPQTGSLIYRTELPCLAVPHEIYPDAPSAFSEEQFHRLAPGFHIIQPNLHTFDQSIRAELAQMQKNANNANDCVMYTEDVESIPSLVSCGLHSSLVNETHILQSAPNVSLVRLPFMPPIRKGVFWLLENSSPILADFLKLLSSQIQPSL